jgi:hypothetical protein
MSTEHLTNDQIKANHRAHILAQNFINKGYWWGFRDASVTALVLGALVYFLI